MSSRSGRDLRPLAALALAACSSGSSGSTAPRAAVVCGVRATAAPVGELARFTVDASAKGAAFVTAADVNGDRRLDLVVSTFGRYSDGGGAYTFAPGEVTAYLQGDGLGCWQKQVIVGPSAGIYFPNQTTVTDVDGDGDADVVVPAGFFACVFDPKVKACGALAWMEQDGGEWKRHDVVPPGGTAFYHHAEVVDFDGDGVRDLVSGAESNARLRWFKGTTTPARFAPTPLEIGEGGGSFPQVLDVDGDGDLDVASAEFFVEKSSFAWFERVAAPSTESPAGTWARHILDATSGRGMQLAFVPNLYGDGVRRAVGTNHVGAGVEAGLFVFEPGRSLREPWSKRAIASGIAARPTVGAAVSLAPGVFGWGDVDGDGDVDFAVAGDGDARTFWIEQTAPGQFATHVIEEKLGQSSGALVVDLDGDGKSEIVFTGYEDDVVYVYARR